MKNLNQFKTYLQSIAPPENEVYSGEVYFLTNNNLPDDLVKSIEFWTCYYDSCFGYPPPVQLQHFDFESWLPFTKYAAYSVAAVFYFKFKNEFSELLAAENIEDWQRAQDFIMGAMFTRTHSTFDIEDCKNYQCSITGILFDTNIDDIADYCEGIDTPDDITPDEAYLLLKDNDHVEFLYNKLFL